MKIDTSSTESAMAPAATIPQKRKTRSTGGGRTSGAHGQSEEGEQTRSTTELPGKGEYETGRVICESCGEGVSFRDESTGGFTVKHWEAHRLQCANAPQVNPEPVSPVAEVSYDASQPQSKRRRAKRTEEERIEYLRSDPYVAQFEAYRVLCGSCDKWIRLRPNSTYCSIPWDAHRKSCLAKRAAKSTHPIDDRNAVFASDLNVRKFDSERVLCRTCETWVHIGNADNNQAAKIWSDHCASCQPDASDSSTPAPTTANIPTIDSVPPPSKHLLALASSSYLPMISPPIVNGGTATSISTSSISTPVSQPSLKDLTTSFYPPGHEPKRRNAEQRAAQLRADPLAGDVEPNRVFCTICSKWVQLRQDSAYCAYPWQQHRNKCLRRRERRSQKEAELADVMAQRGAMRYNERYMATNGADDSDDPESEEGVESVDEEEGTRRREDRRKAKAVAQAEFLSPRVRQEDAHPAGMTNGRRRSLVSEASEGEADAADDDAMDVDAVHPARFADLDTPPGRLQFAFQSVKFLFQSTFERTDELTIAALVTFLNAAMPADKHEDYDTTEVTKAAFALHERGGFALEGDVIRILY